MRLDEIHATWDLVIIGGGITGAGILREAIRAGLRVVLIEQKDFAWGTSSRSSKMVHGGLRYIKEGKLFLTKIAVEERERLLEDAPGLVESLGFLLPVYEDQRPGRRALKVGLSLYDVLAGERQHKFYNAAEFAAMIPYVKREGLTGGFHFFDAQVDDSRLVLRLISESVACGACALNYISVTGIIRNTEEAVTAVAAQDTETRQTKIINSPAVINATGSWAEKLHPSPDPHRHLRPLRGSHLVFPAQILPLTEGFTFMHPQDNRPVFIVPWEGAVLVGTTDLDHEGDLSVEPKISEQEAAYLIEGVRALFPSLDLTLNNCICSFAGIRPVLSEGKLPPSEESREHVVWVDKGLVTVTGGKLTTFRRLAWDALKSVKPYLPSNLHIERGKPIFDTVPDKPIDDFGLSADTWRRLYGRYGASADRIVTAAKQKDLAMVPGTFTLWAELPYLAKHENIRHLADLLLRRVRIGLLTPKGGDAYIKRIRKLCRASLPWDRKRWKREVQIYRDQWKHFHALPAKPTESRVQENRKANYIKALGTALSSLYDRIQSALKRKAA
jgi:glycerol-3-phosphate dehydrogenase